VDDLVSAKTGDYVSIRVSDPSKTRIFVSRITGPYFVLVVSYPFYYPTKPNVWWSCLSASGIVISESQTYVVVNGSFGGRFATVEIKRALKNYGIEVRVAEIEEEL
jgi:hypothetical protein